MKKSRKTGFIGAGNMGSALLKSLVKSGRSAASDIYVYDIDIKKLDALTAELPLQICANNREVVESSELVFLCVKPQYMQETLDSLAEADLDGRIFISIAAGLKTSDIRKMLGGRTDVIARVMPNTPVLAGAGAGAVSYSAAISPKDRADILDMLSAAALILEVEENDMDAVTALSGSGPAFVFELIIQMVRAAKAEGLSEDKALSLTVKTVQGAAKLLEFTGKDPETLRNEVTSPGGTTQAGLESLARDDFSRIIGNMIHAAAVRSRELSSGT